MIPGVGYFYSGMARSKSALSLIMLSCWSIAVVTVQVFKSFMNCLIQYKQGTLTVLRQFNIQSLIKSEK